MIRDLKGGLGEVVFLRPLQNLSLTDDEVNLEDVNKQKMQSLSNMAGKYIDTCFDVKQFYSLFKKFDTLIHPPL